jgi:hypothetical protein
MVWTWSKPASSFSIASSQLLITPPGQVVGKQVADHESRPSVGLVVERRLEWLQALLQVAGHVHDALEELSVGNLGQVDVDVDAEVGLAAATAVHRWKPPARASNSTSVRQRDAAGPDDDRRRQTVVIRQPPGV